MSPEFKRFLIADRQWKREHRIAHAKHQLAAAKTTGEHDFWRSVLDANATKE